MNILRSPLIAAAIGLAALASSPARADLVISCTSSTDANWCNGFGGTHTGNDLFSYTGSAGPYSATEIVTGVALLPSPYVLEVHNFEINVTGPGQLSVFVTENGLSGTGIGSFLMNFGTSQIIGALSGVSREFWLDYGTNNQVLLGTCSGPNGTSCNISSASVNLSGAYSVTEEFDMTAGRNCSGTMACELSTDDAFSLAVPEPVSLSLFGSGLLALGAIARRRRKVAAKV
jgi:hypothetical protein